MLKYCLLFTAFFIYSQTVICQQAAIDRQQFFLDTSIINLQLTTDIKKLKANKKKPEWQAAYCTMNLGASDSITGQIRLEQRGNYRKDHCELASLMLDFKTKTSPALSDLKKLKLVGGCHENEASEEPLLKEYLAYKLYNILSPMSFRVRLLKVTYTDSEKKIKPYTQYAFLIEDIQDLAKRNNCREVTKIKYATEATSRSQITFVSIFQYMIGNTDWAVPNYHNIKLMVPLHDTLASPYVVPYDFDFCGLVNAPYASPNEELGIKSVTDRYYQGYKRTLDELKPIAAVFNKHQEEIMQYATQFNRLGKKDKDEIRFYLEKFFDIMQSESALRYTFISNGLTPN